MFFYSLLPKKRPYWLQVIFDQVFHVNRDVTVLKYEVQKVRNQQSPKAVQSEIEKNGCLF